MQKEADAYLEPAKSGKEPVNHMAGVSLNMLMMYGKSFGGNYKDIAMDETLGLGVMDDKELEKSVARWLNN